ncbi:class D sortase [Candidatus Wolfebacteria bacterium]|nr:class D sortase [Candidatus Wolfebacteria bacterium]
MLESQKSRIIQFFKRFKPYISFFALWILIFAVLFLILYFSGLMPDYMKDFTKGAFAYLMGERPKMPKISEFSKDTAVLVIPKLGIVSPIIFPESKDLAVLKKALDSGVVHYPDSALPEQNGNVFIFGHSSSKAFEKNPYRTIFTKLNQTKVGDEIIVRSFGIKYYYRVTSVEIVDPKESKVYLESKKPILTLSTCWPVGDPTNRFVVEAEFARKDSIVEN